MMKNLSVAAATLLLSMACTSWGAANAASVANIRSSDAVRKLLAKSRRLEDENEEEEEDEYSFLQNYKLKFMTCKSGEKWKGEDDYEYSVVVYRLCPSDSCDSETSSGCSQKYGDFVVGLNTFVEAYFEDQRDNMEGDDDFNLEEYRECREYEQQNQDERRRLDGNGGYYIGPACTDDGKDVKLELFSDYICTTVPEDVTFEDLSNGASLPYSDGGIISTSCKSCYAKNDNGEYEISEFCQSLYEYSGRCETNMESYSSYGKSEGQCEYITELMPAKKKKGKGKKIFLTLFFLAIIGAVAYFFIQKRKQQAVAGKPNKKGLLA